mmetsp:Transcript_43414/g.86111  ORF Transcript_43414/g.86111 Transcript_43414/m.86111 type:complete len:239 (-) Transcript_43414:74-790(-)
MEWSRLKFKLTLVPSTATGDFVAISFARVLASSKHASFVGKILPTSPSAFMSFASSRLPVNAISRTTESLPTIFGNRCKVPMSAAMPILTSAIDIQVSSLQYRMSQALTRSTPPPTTPLCMAATTGFTQCSMLEIASCSGRIIEAPIRNARRLTSCFEGVSNPESPDIIPFRSKPAVKMRELPPCTTTQRTSGSSEACVMQRFRSAKKAVLNALSASGLLSPTSSTPSSNTASSVAKS